MKPHRNKRRVLAGLVLGLLFAAGAAVSIWWGQESDIRPAYSTAALMAERVRNGELSDCEALAQFAESWSEQAPDSELFLRGFNVFVPQGKINYPVGVPIGLDGVQTALKLEGQASGYRRQFRKGFGPQSMEGTPHDQAHHFAPYLIVGAGVPEPVARVFLGFAEKPETWGDIQLARRAIEMGGQLRRQELRPGQLAQRIREQFCLPRP